MDTETDQPEASEDEQEQATGERRNEEAMRYPGHDDPERASERSEDGV
jgi:hypothetical protein